MEMTTLSALDTDKLHDMTLILMEKTGLRILNEAAREIFRHHGATIDGDLVRIPPFLVEESLAVAPSSFTLRARNCRYDRVIGINRPPVYASTVGSVFVIDSDQGRRLSTAKDHETLMKLSHTSPVAGLSCAPAVFPKEFKGIDGILHQMYNAITYSDKPLLGQAQDKVAAERAIAMASLAMDGSNEPFVMGICNSLSPLAWDEKMLDAIMVYAKAGQPLVLTCCSMMGLTSPMGILDTVLVNNAEILTGITLAEMVNPGTPVVYGNTSSAVDMRTMGLVLGTPEYSQISAGGAKLAAYYGLPYRSGGGLTDAKSVDPQAASESALNLSFSRSAGVNLMFHALGSLDSFLSVSYEKWLLDEETIVRQEDLYTPLPALNEECLSIVEEVGPMGNFLEHPSTFNRYRETLFLPILANRENYDAWKTRSEDFVATAQKKLKERLEAYEQPYLDGSVEKQLKAFLIRYDLI